MLFSINLRNSTKNSVNMITASDSTQLKKEVFYYDLLIGSYCIIHERAAAGNRASNILA